MARTPSKPIALGSPLPVFSLPDTLSGKTIEVAQPRGSKGLLVMFICNHCPFVKHIQQALVDISKEYQEKGIEFVAICSNDVENYPEDSPERMKQVGESYGYTFPYLYDGTQEVARRFDAACTPEFYLYDRNGLLVYHGQFDDSRPDNNFPVTGRDLRVALDGVVGGVPINGQQKASLGCNIKWKNVSVHGAN